MIKSVATLLFPKPGVQSGQRCKAPIPLLALAAGMSLAFLSDQFLARIGINVSYLGWMIPLLGSAAFLLTRYGQIRFPLWIWVPWALWVLLYLVEAEADNALQRSIMLLTPLVVGVAFSALRVDDALLAKCDAWLDRFILLFLAAAGMATGLLSGALYDITGFAAGAITASLLAAWYAACYAMAGEKRALLLWALLAAVPVLAVTRTGMVAVAITLPLTLAPWPWKNRLVVVGLLLVAGLAVFQMERVQNKMFYSGQGTLEEATQGVVDMLTGSNKETNSFATSGRQAMNKALLPGIQEAYWLGHGANTTEEISLTIAGVAHPHNDWLRLQYEYGTWGLLLFAISLLGQALHALRRARRLAGAKAVFLYAGASAFIPMALYMFSDNVILYAAWFGNLQFAMLGIGYATTRKRTKRSVGLLVGI